MNRKFTFFVAALAMLMSSLKGFALKSSDLTVVAEAETTIEQFVRNTNYYTLVTVDLKSQFETSGFLVNGVGMWNEKNYTNVFLDQLDEETESRKGELTNVPTYVEQDNEANNGWWLSAVFNEDLGEETGECVAASWSEKTKLGVTGFTFDTDGVMSFWLTQVGERLEAGRTYFVDLYVGSVSETAGEAAKMVKVRVNLNVVPSPVYKLSEIEKAGEKTFDLSIYRNGLYKYTIAELDIQELCDALVVPNGQTYDANTAPLTLYAMSKDGEGVLSCNGTANYGGFWLTADSKICKYDDEDVKIFCEPDWEYGLSKLHVGMGYYNIPVGETVNAQLYVIGDNKKYMQLNINLEVKAAPTFNDCVTIDSIAVTMEIIPDPNKPANVADPVYLVQEDYMKEAIDLDAQFGIFEKLGTDSPVFYMTSYDPAGNLLTYTAAYSGKIPSSCGYLMMDLGFFIDQGAGSPEMLHTGSPFVPQPVLTTAFGIGYEDGKLSFWQDAGDRECGDWYHNEGYLANIEEGKRIYFTVNVIYTDERTLDLEFVGKTEVTLPAANAAYDDFAETQYDLSEVMAALGCENADDIVWKTYDSLGQLTPDATEMYGFLFDDKGGYYPFGIETNAFSVGYMDGTFHSYAREASATNEVSYTARLVATYNKKAYAFTVTVTNAAGAGIALPTVSSPVSNAIYDLSGRIVRNPSRGIYISGGKKYIVK